MSNKINIETEFENIYEAKKKIKEITEKEIKPLREDIKEEFKAILTMAKQRGLPWTNAQVKHMYTLYEIGRLMGEDALKSIISNVESFEYKTDGDQE